MKNVLLVTALLIGLSSTGCRIEAGQDDPGRTLVERESLDPKADALLDDVDRAWQAGDYTAVLVGLDSAARYAPRLADIPFWRGRTKIMLNRLTEARAAFQAALDLDPYYPGAWYELGNIDYRERQFGSAVEKFQREEAVLLRLLDEEVTLSEPMALAATRLQMGRAHNRLDQVDRAYEAFRQALAADSTFSEAYYELGQLYRDDGELDKALEQARRAYTSDSSSADNAYLLGALLLSDGRPGEAMPYLENSVGRRPWYHPALNSMGRALQRLGRQEEAEEVLKRAEEMQALQVDIEQARLDVQQSPDESKRWIELAEVLVHARRYDEAEDAFNRAIVLEPLNLTYHNDAANLALIRGDAAGAIRRFQSILDFDSTFADGWMNLGVAYALSGRYDEAQQAWTRVLEQVPNHAEAKANLARLAEVR